jgi:hypothetical protein
MRIGGRSVLAPGASTPSASAGTAVRGGERALSLAKDVKVKVLL